MINIKENTSKDEELIKEFYSKLVRQLRYNKTNIGVDKKYLLRFKDFQLEFRSLFVHTINPRHKEPVLIQHEVQLRPKGIKTRELSRGSDKSNFIDSLLDRFWSEELRDYSRFKLSDSKIYYSDLVYSGKYIKQNVTDQFYNTAVRIDKFLKKERDNTGITATGRKRM